MVAHCQSVLTRGRGTPHMKGLGILVVSLRGVKFGFWSHLGCSGQNAITIKVSLRVTREKIEKIYIVCVLTWSLLGVKKSFGHAQIALF